MKARRMSDARVALIGVLCVLVVAGVVTGVALSQGHKSGATTNVTKPFPLDIPVKQRTPPELAEGRLMMFPALASQGALAALPHSLKGKVKDPATQAQIRLAISAPVYSYSTAASPDVDLVSVYSTTPTGNGFQLAMMGVIPKKPLPKQLNCLEIRYSPGQPVAYGVTTLTSEPYNVQVNGCTGKLTPASGWMATWPSPTALYPPKTPIKVPSMKFAPIGH